MKASNLSSRVIRFGVFEADLSAGELRKHGLRLKLPEQPFQILVMLLEKPGNVVSRDELRNRLWPGDTFVDFDHGLNNAVMRLREVLSDSSDMPRFIETLPRRGYRFIAPVEELGTPIERPSSAASLSTAGPIDSPAVLPPADRSSFLVMRKRCLPLSRFAMLSAVGLTGAVALTAVAVHYISGVNASKIKSDR